MRWWSRANVLALALPEDPGTGPDEVVEWLWKLRLYLLASNLCEKGLV